MKDHLESIQQGWAQIEQEIPEEEELPELPRFLQTVEMLI